MNFPGRDSMGRQPVAPEGVCPGVSGDGSGIVGVGRRLHATDNTVQAGSRVSGRGGLGRVRCRSSQSRRVAGHAEPRLSALTCRQRSGHSAAPEQAPDVHLHLLCVGSEAPGFRAESAVGGSHVAVSLGHFAVWFAHASPRGVRFAGWLVASSWQLDGGSCPRP